MPKEKRLNDKETNEVLERLFSEKYHRGHERYTYIEFAEDKQIAIDRFKTKLSLLKDMTTSVKAMLGVSDDVAKRIIEDNQIVAFMCSNSELVEDIKPLLVQYNPFTSNDDIKKVHLEVIDKIKKQTGYGTGILKDLPNKEYGSKLADALYIFDCRKFDLTFEFIKYEIDKYYPKTQKIKTKTIKQYFEDTYKLYINL